MKQKNTAPPATAAPDAEADELGALEKEFAPLKPKMARMELLRKSIRQRYDAAPPDQPFTVTGAHFIVQIGARAVERSINYPKLIKAMGVKAFAAIARVTLGVLEENVSCSVVADVVTSDYTGTRSVKTFEKGPA